MSYKFPDLCGQMKKHGFAIPSCSAIARWLQVMDLKSSVSADLLNKLKARVKFMSENEKKVGLTYFR